MHDGNVEHAGNKVRARLGLGLGSLGLGSLALGLLGLGSLGVGLG